MTLVSSDDSLVLATQHDKHRVIAPVFADILGWDVRPVAIDTDQFGTFSGERPRVGSPEQTAYAKARAGMMSAGVGRGLASEGSIGPDPRMPIITVDQEIIVYLDDHQGISLAQWHTSADIIAFRHTVSEQTSWPEVQRQADLPQHAVIVTNAGDEVTWVRKGLRDINEVAQAVSDCESATGSGVVIETDYRAMVCPSRQRVIGQCAELLANRLATPCPACATPGWGVVSHEYALACLGCGGLVEQARRADVWGCALCSHTQAQVIADGVDPAHCPACNP